MAPHFIGDVITQHYPFRGPMMSYIKADRTAIAPSKLIQTCKEFFVKNPIFVIDYMICYKTKLDLHLNKESLLIDFKKLCIFVELVTFLFSTPNSSAKPVPENIYCHPFIQF